MAPRKSTAPGKALTNYDDQLAALAKRAKKAESGVGLGQFISFKSGQLSYLGSPIKENLLNLVVLTHMLENAYYTDSFDPDNPASPKCYAYSDIDDEDGSAMRPHEKSSEPQGDPEEGTCRGCPQNVFGTADKGKGKACRNSRRLAIIVEGDAKTPESIAAASVAFVRLPVTSVKAWAACVKSMVDNFERPPLCFVVEMSVEATPNGKAPYQVLWDVREQIADNDPRIGALIAKAAAIEPELRQPYAEVEAAPARPVRGATTKPNPAKAAAAKKFARAGR